MAKVKNIQIENAQIGFRNFRGECDRYNKTGRRTFAVFLDSDQAADLEAEGWKIKYRKPNPDYPEDEPSPYMNVEVKYGKYPPAIHLISGNNQELLTEDTVSLLDSADIENIDLVISPYSWSKDDGSSGIKAYLKSAWVTIAMDPFAAKYSRRPRPDVYAGDDEDAPF